MLRTISKSKLLLFFDVFILFAAIEGVSYIYDNIISLQEMNEIHQGAVSNIGSLQAILALVLVIIVANLFFLIDYWTNKQKNELKVRKLCGAGIQSLRHYLITSILSLSLLAAVVVSIITKIFSVYILKDVPMYPKINIFTSIIFTFIQIIFVLIMFKRQLTHSPTRRRILIIRYILFAGQIFFAIWVLLLAVYTLKGYLGFMDSYNQVYSSIKDAGYISTINPDEFPDSDKETAIQFEKQVNKITSGKYFSFSEGSIELEDEAPLKYISNSHKNYQSFYITANVPDIYDWSCDEGTLFTEQQLKGNDKYIPVLLGADYSKIYDPGDIIDSKYYVQGILNDSSFYINPRWNGISYSLNQYIVIPMIYGYESWGGMLINQLNLLEGTNAQVKQIQELVYTFGITKITYTQTSKQVSIIETDTSLALRKNAVTVSLLMVISVVSQISAILNLIETRKKEFGIKMLCGSSKRRIIIKLILKNGINGLK